VSALAKMIKNKMMLELERVNRTKATKSSNNKMNDKDIGWTSRREPTDESSTRLHYLYEYSQQSYGQGLAPSS